MKTRLLIAVTAVTAAILIYWLRSTSISSTGKVVIAEGTQPIAGPVYVAYAKGFFKEEGVDVQLASFPTGKFCLDALLGGKADFATVAETPIMHASFKNQPMKIVATMHRSRLNTYCVARKDRGVNVPGDLKGKTVAVPFGTNGEYALAAFLAKNGLTLGDLTLVNLSPPEMIGPITKGDVAGVAAWQPHIGRCEKSLGENGVHFSFDQAYEETYNLVTSTKMAAERGTTVAKILKALDRAVVFMGQNPNEAIEIVAQRIDMEKTELERIWPIYHFGLDLRQSLIETMSAQGKWAVERGHQTGVVPNMRDVVSTAALRSLKPESVELPGSN
jgi:NitT/TauT family transport system substrate-binding protein